MSGNTEYGICAHNRIRVCLQVGDDDEPLAPEAMSRDVWTLLRETLTLWRAIACCRGYCELENRAFWDCVTDDLHLSERLDAADRMNPPKANKTTLERIDQFHLLLCIVSYIGDQPERFPELLGFQDRLMRRVMAFNSATESSESVAFKSAWKRIQPFIDPVRASRMAPLVRVRLELETSYSGSCSTILTALPPLAEKIRQVPVCETKGIRFPQLKFQELCFKHWEVKMNTQLDSLTSFLSTLDTSLQLTKLKACVQGYDGREAFSRFIRYAFGLQQVRECAADSRSPRLLASELQPPLVTLKSLTLTGTAMHWRHIVALCSALPHTRSLAALTLDVPHPADGGETWSLSQFDAVWIGYAIFHPKTRTSSFRSLTLPHCASFDRDERGVFLQMVLDPLSLLSTPALAQLVYTQAQLDELGSADRRQSQIPAIPFVEDRIQIARVKRGAQLRASRIESDPIWIMLEHEMSLEMCETSEDGCCFYCVLVSGFGFGWVRQDDVLEVSEWAIDLPLKPPLTSFECGRDIPPSKTNLMLSAVGANLRALRVVQNTIPPRILDSIAQACPNLQHLELAEVYGDTSLSRDPITRFFSQPQSQLRSLTIDWGLCNIDALIETLSRGDQKTQAVATLKTLYICSIQDLTDYYAKVAPFENLLRVNKTLEQLWLSTYVSQARTSSSSREPRLRAFNGEDLTLFTPLRQRLAFLSVVPNHATRKVRGRTRHLDATLVRIILEFAVPRVRRRVRIRHLLF